MDPGPFREGLPCLDAIAAPSRLMFGAILIIFVPLDLQQHRRVVRSPSGRSSFGFARKIAGRLKGFYSPRCKSSTAK